MRSGVDECYHNNPLGPACESASRGVFGIDGYLVAREGSGVKEIPRVSPGRIPVTPPSRGVRSSPEGKGVQGILPVPGTGAGVPGVLDTSRTTPEDPFGSWSRLRCSSPVGGNRQGGFGPGSRGSVGGKPGVPLGEPVVPLGEPRATSLSVLKSVHECARAEHDLERRIHV